MEHMKDLLEMVRGRLVKMAESNAVVGQPISVGGRHIVPLVELKAGFGAGGGSGQGEQQRRKSHARHERGEGGGAGAGTKVAPVALLVIDGDDVRVERLD